MFDGVIEREIETAFSRRRKFSRQPHRGEFLKGPIPMAALDTAARLPGKALAVYLAIQHRAALTGGDQVTLPAARLAAMGVSKDAKSRALTALEAADLITLDRASGRAARIRLLADA
jgi:DNA-binding transcriptional ArsR family regulator